MDVCQIHSGGWRFFCWLIMRGCFSTKGTELQLGTIKRKPQLIMQGREWKNPSTGEPWVVPPARLRRLFPIRRLEALRLRVPWLVLRVC
jgi:hypothetical protein